jgi:hypothetical protein
MKSAREAHMRNAVADYHWIMAEVEKEKGSRHRMKSDVAEYVANLENIKVETLIDRINRSEKAKSLKEENNGVPHAVRQFHHWLHRTGRLPDHPPYIPSIALGVALLSGQGD